VSDEVKGVAIAAPQQLLPLRRHRRRRRDGVEADPVDTLGTLILGADELVVTLGTETFGTLIVGAAIFETLGKNGTEL
jgi:hypothetical protein